jgi:hypothetical protein
MRLKLPQRLFFSLDPHRYNIDADDSDRDGDGPMGQCTAMCDGPGSPGEDRLGQLIAPPVPAPEA